MRIDFGQQVICQGGEQAGEVTAIVIDTQSREITHIALARSKLVANDWLIPLSEAQGTTSQGLLLHARAEQLPALPQFVQGLEVAPGEKAREMGSAAGGTTGTNQSRALEPRKNVILLHRDCPVHAIDGHLGVLRGVLTDVYDNRLSSIVIDSSGTLAGPTAIPVQWIDEIRSGAVKLATSSERAKQLLGPEAGAYVSTEKGPSARGDRQGTKRAESVDPDYPFGGEL